MRTTKTKILKLLLQLIITNIIILGVFYYWFHDDVSILRNSKLILGIFILIIMPFIPQLVIILNHYCISKDLIISKKENKIIVSLKKLNIEINEKNIDSWVLIGTAGKIKKSSIKFSLLDDLFYIKIKLKNGKSIILTSLISNEIDSLFEKKFNSFKLDPKIVYFPFIRNISNYKP